MINGVAYQANSHTTCSGSVYFWSISFWSNQKRRETNSFSFCRADTFNIMSYPHSVAKLYDCFQNVIHSKQYFTWHMNRYSNLCEAAEQPLTVDSQRKNTTHADYFQEKCYYLRVTKWRNSQCYRSMNASGQMVNFASQENPWLELRSQFPYDRCQRFSLHLIKTVVAFYLPLPFPGRSVSVLGSLFIFAEQIKPCCFN